jgi:single-stranded DNA-binding protein
MVGNTIENNMVTISGKVSSDIQFSHEVYGEGFYYFILDVPRLSDSCDKIPITVSERLVLKQKIEIGRIIEVEGQFRSHNSYDGAKNKLLLTVFAREITFLEDDAKKNNPNQIFLNGFVCKKPVFRTTPFGREISDMLIAVNRPYFKADYLPCISWGRNARYCENLSVGSNVKIWGRIQSREYQKVAEDGTAIKKTAFEVSVSKMEICNSEEKSAEEKNAKADEQENANLNANANSNATSNAASDSKE